MNSEKTVNNISAEPTLTQNSRSTPRSFQNFLIIWLDCDFD